MKLDIVESVSPLRVQGSVRTFEQSSVPSNAQQFDRWFEVGSLTTPRFPQPWEYLELNAGSSLYVWTSPPICLTKNFTASLNAQQFGLSLPATYGVIGFRSVITHVSGRFRTTGTHDGSNFYAFNLKAFRSDTTIWNISVPFATNTNGMSSTLERRLDQTTQVNSNLLPGNAWSLIFETVKTGTPANVDCDFTVMMRFVRP